MKKAVLLVVPGTSCPEAALVLDGLNTRIAERFSDTAHALAFSSRGILAKLEEEGRGVDSPEQALVRLRAAGTTHVVIKPLHMVAGMEYAELQESVTQIQLSEDPFQNVFLDRPLLEAQADAERLIRPLLDAIPPQTDPDGARVLVAHGSRRAGTDHSIETANAFCRHLDSQVFVGTMIAKPDRADIVRLCKKDEIRHVQLIPFMIVAGYSARHEIGGDEPGSWKHAMEEAGVACVALLKGLAEYDAIVGIWLDRISELLDEVEDDASAAAPARH